MESIDERFGTCPVMEHGFYEVELYAYILYIFLLEKAGKK